MSKYTIGIDFGSLSGRAVLMDAESGTILDSSVYEYPHAVMNENLPDGTPLPLNTALQHPTDYIEVLSNTIPRLLSNTGTAPEDVVGIGVDFTACTMLPVDKNMKPLCLYEEYSSEPDAYVKLWKHNASQPDADEINRIAIERKEKWLDIYGGKIAADWMLPKIRQILRESPEIYEKTARFIEAGDWISYVLTGEETHSACFAGFKALWNDELGYPSSDFHAAISPKLKDLVGTKLSDKVDMIGGVAGKLSASGAELTGLKEGTAVAIPIIDAHASIPALGITDESTMLLIVGTSGVAMINSPKKIDISGICGRTYGSVIPKMYTYEAATCCGDHFDWFVKNCVPEAYENDAKDQGISIHKYLREKARKLRAGESGLLALDWFNGNRSVLSDASLTGMILGMTLRARPEEIYRALIEATAYGNRVILDTFTDGGMNIEHIVASGGIAEKDDMLVQIYCDVLNRPITVSDAKMSASCGSAIYASVAAGIYPGVREAVEKLSVRTGKTYTPITENVAVYERLFAEYKTLHDYFGRGENGVMKRLRNIRI